MIEKTIKTTSGKLRVKIPTQLDELTLGQMMALQENPEIKDIEAISILSGISLDDLHNVTNYQDFHELGNSILSLAAQISHLYTITSIPKQIEFVLPLKDGFPAKKTKVKVMQNLSIEPVGAFMAARDIITDEINTFIKKHGEENWREHFNPSLKTCCEVLAQYFYCAATGNTYNEYNANAFTSEVKKLRVTEALPISRHFFSCYPNLSKPKTSFWRRLLPNSKKGQGYKPSKSLNISIP
jgi:hypothetical protein